MVKGDIPAKSMDNFKWNQKKYLNNPKEVREKKGQKAGRTNRKQNMRANNKIVDLNPITSFNHQTDLLIYLFTI